VKGENQIAEDATLPLPRQGERVGVRGISPFTLHPSLLVKRLGLVDYIETWEAMKAFTASRTSATADEIWLLEHPPVYTYGVAGRAQHLPRADNGIPVIKVDRGGQVTYHGPGQLVAYALVDLRRRGLSVRDLVRALEQAVLDLLSQFGVAGDRREAAPGVYVSGAKVAALGLRIRRGASYHGLSLNVDMDLAPFHVIDPCGYPDLEITQLRDLGITEPPARIAELLAAQLAQHLDTVKDHR
jgi:lipoyl(octanoyl) transferase